MNVLCTQNEVVIVEITRDELFSCNLTYKKLEENSLKSKAAVLKIISQVGIISGSSIRMTEKTRVDILPDGQDGCVIVINNRDSGRDMQYLRIYESSSLDAIIDFARSAGRDEKAAARLYKRGEMYRLALFAGRNTHLECSEFLFSRFLGREALCETEKQFECLIDSNALKILGGFTS